MRYVFLIMLCFGPVLVPALAEEWTCTMRDMAGVAGAGIQVQFASRYSDRVTDTCMTIMENSQEFVLTRKDGSRRVIIKNGLDDLDAKLIRR